MNIFKISGNLNSIRNYVSMSCGKNYGVRIRYLVVLVLFLIYSFFGF